MQKAKEAALATVSEAARIFKKSEQTIRNWERAGKLPGFRAGNGFRLFFREDIEKLRTQLDGAK